MAEKTINSKFYKPNVQNPLGETYLKLTYDPTTGVVKLYQYNEIGGIVGVETEVYRDGVWKYNPGAVTTVEEKNNVQQKVISSISKLKSDPRNIIPTFVTQNLPSRDEGSSGEIYPSQNSGGFIGKIAEGISNIYDQNVDPDKYYFNTTQQEKDLFGTPELLKYPKDILDNQQDTFQISQYRYNSPARNIFADGTNVSSVISQGLQRNSAITDFIGKVVLPMPNEVIDSNGVGWADERISNFELGAAAYMHSHQLQNLAGNALLDLLGLAAKAATAEETGGALNSFIDKGIEGFKGIFTSGDMGALDPNRPDLKALLTSKLLKQIHLDVSPETILKRGYGIIPNSNLELLFNGPLLRNFTFTYRMSPRSDKEARNVKRIIRFFKQGMAARRYNSQSSTPVGAGAASLYLGTPNIFKLRYTTSGNNDISGVNKFKLCALTNCSVSYAPDGQWSAYEEGQPTSVIMGLAFTEIEPIYNTDYQENGILTGKDIKSNQPPVYPDDVGF
jgi:hypothetical protein